MKKLFLFILSIMLTTSLFSQYLIQEGFETTPFAFVTDSISGVPNWTQNSIYFAGGTKSIRGTVPASGFTQFTSIVLNTTNKPNVYLKFKHICKLAPTDQGLVRYRINGGTWLNLPATAGVYFQPSAGGYLSSQKFTSSCYTEWESANLTATPQASWWKSELFDISSICGNQTSV